MIVMKHGFLITRLNSDCEVYLVYVVGVSMLSGTLISLKIVIVTPPSSVSYSNASESIVKLYASLLWVTMSGNPVTVIVSP